jgi:hypothetical protein
LKLHNNTSPSFLSTNFYPFFGGEGFVAHFALPLLSTLLLSPSFIPLPLFPYNSVAVHAAPRRMRSAVGSIVCASTQDGARAPSSRPRAPCPTRHTAPPTRLGQNITIPYPLTLMSLQRSVYFNTISYFLVVTFSK